MAFRQFAIMLFAFGLLSAAASSSSTSSAATSEETTTTAEGSANGEASSSSTSSAAASEIAASEISTTAAEETTTTAEGSANGEASVKPAYEQSVSFRVSDIQHFCIHFNKEDFKKQAVNFKKQAVKDSLNIDVVVSVSIKLTFMAAYRTDIFSKEQMASALGISVDKVEVSEFDVVESAEVVLTVQIFATPGVPLPPPTLRLKSAAENIEGVIEDSIKVTAATGTAVDDGVLPLTDEVVDPTAVDDGVLPLTDEVVDPSSNSVLPWVFTAGLAGIVALF